MKTFTLLTKAHAMFWLINWNKSDTRSFWLFFKDLTNLLHPDLIDFGILTSWSGTHRVDSASIRWVSLSFSLKRATSARAMELISWFPSPWVSFSLSISAFNSGGKKKWYFLETDNGCNWDSAKCVMRKYLSSLYMNVYFSFFLWVFCKFADSV